MRNSPDDQLYADVVIVGSGVSGTLMATALAARGVSVLILEAGPTVDRQDALERFFETPIKDPQSPYPNPAHAPSPLPHDPDSHYVQAGPDVFQSTYTRIAGGSTWHWLGRTPRFLPEDFRMRTLFGVATDWPISYDDLEPWYGKAEDELGVSGDSADGHGSPRSTPYPMPPIPLSYSDRVVAKALAAQGGPAVASVPQARNSEPRRDRPSCCGSGSCVPICPIQAKYDATVHLERAVAAGARLLTDAVVHRVDVGADGQVSGVRFLRPDRREGQATGRVYVLAAHAIETPKLLLMSRSERTPDGVANRSGQVGRNLMEHVSQVSWGLSPVPLWQYRGPLTTATVRAGRDGPERATRACFDISLGNTGWDWGGPSAAQTAAALALKIADPATLQTAIADRLSRKLQIWSDIEVLPNPDNRIVPDFDRLDTLGLPRPRLHYRLGDYEKAGAAAARTAHSQVFDALGASEVSHASHTYGAGHVIGTCRMGNDPATSVVTPGLRTHDHPNLYLLGSGTFPTAGSANPTLTIAALTLRAVDGILSALKSFR